MIEKPTKKELIALIVLGTVLIVISIITALAISSFNARNADGHMRHHEYPKPCDSGLVGSQEATISFEGGEDIRICPTLPVEPSVSPELTPEPSEATPSAEPTAPPAGHGDGLSDGRSDGKSDGRSSSPQITLTPCSVPNTCGMK